jgi:hypothetical protein
VTNEDLKKLITNVADQSFRDGHNSGITKGREQVRLEHEHSESLRIGVRYAQERAVECMNGRLQNIAARQRYQSSEATPPSIDRDIYAEIRSERARQDIQWGSAHDDGHTVLEWRALRGKFEQRVSDMLDSPHEGVYELADGRIALIKIAALAIAQLESLDRSVTP